MLHALLLPCCDNHEILFSLDSRHSIAISQMGNYQDYLKQTSPLRELDPGMNRAHMFGNPFKLAKDQVLDFFQIYFSL